MCLSWRWLPQSFLSRTKSKELNNPLPCKIFLLRIKISSSLVGGSRASPLHTFWLCKVSTTKWFSWRKKESVQKDLAHIMEACLWRILSSLGPTSLCFKSCLAPFKWKVHNALGFSSFSRSLAPQSSCNTSSFKTWQVKSNRESRHAKPLWNLVKKNCSTWFSSSTLDQRMSNLGRMQACLKCGTSPSL